MNLQGGYSEIFILVFEDFEPVDRNLFVIGYGRCVIRIASAMDQDEKSEYIERLEHRIQILSNENAALAVTLNKLLRENMKLKAENKSLEMRIAALNQVPEIRLPPENFSE